MFGGVLTRNLVPSLGKAKSSHGVKLVMGLFLVFTAILSTFASSIMLTFLNVALALTAQLVPAWFGVLFFRKFKAPALSIGLVIGCALVTYFYFSKLTPWNVNTGLIALVVNFAFVIIFSMIFKTGASSQKPVGMRAREILTAATDATSVHLPSTKPDETTDVFIGASHPGSQEK